MKVLKIYGVSCPKLNPRPYTTLKSFRVQRSKLIKMKDYIREILIKSNKRAADPNDPNCKIYEVPERVSVEDFEQRILVDIEDVMSMSVEEFSLWKKDGHTIFENKFVVCSSDT